MFIKAPEVIGIASAVGCYFYGLPTAIATGVIGGSYLVFADQLSKTQKALFVLGTAVSGCISGPWSATITATAYLSAQILFS